VAETASGRFDARRVGWIGGVLLVALLAMLWMAAHRAPHPGSAVAQRIAVLRGLWPADRRSPLVVVVTALGISAADAALVALVATRRPRLGAAGRLALPALAVICVLQLLHQGEHVAQVIQLLVTGGNADLSQGVLTRLNQELVHLVWTSCVWIGSALLLLRFRHNRWLWIALAAASVHEVEHVYLMDAWLHPGLELHGGVNGVLATGGLASGPLQRPYLHFLYNLAELLPLGAALLDELAAAGRVPRLARRGARTAPPRRAIEPQAAPGVSLPGGR
jgi:hypothetical protein